MKQGIDISYHQGNVDFESVKKKGIEFVIIREGYRETADSRFFEYVQKAREAGLTILAVYHFSYALNEEGAKREARICIENMKRAELDPEVLVFFDFEYDTIKKAISLGVSLGRDECNAHTIAFCEMVEQLGYKPGIYTNLDFYKNYYRKDVLSRWSIWLADYTDGPDFHCLIQQYTNKGNIPGIKGHVDLNYLHNDEFKMEDTNKRSRSKVVSLATSWLGKNEADGSYKTIVDTYNSFTGKFPRGIKMKYSWAWCACTWSALAIALGYTDIMPIEISCGFLIEKAKEMGIWQEKDGYIPSPGDAILYDWNDDGVGDNIGWPDHVGVIDYVNENTGYITVIEGNYNDAVKKRTISINGRYIRGFITPKYTDDSWPDETISEIHKEIDVVAREVIVGLWGSGVQRKEALERNGYDYVEIQSKVNEILNGKTTSEISSPKNVESSCYAKSKDSSLSGTYVTTANLYCRNDAGTNKKALCLIPKGTKVINFSYFTTFDGVKWLLIQFTLDGVRYTGFSSSKYLKKIAGLERI